MDHKTTPHPADHSKDGIGLQGLAQRIDELALQVIELKDVISREALDREATSLLTAKAFDGLAAAAYGNRSLNVGHGLTFPAARRMAEDAIVLTENPLPGSIVGQRQSRHIVIPIHPPKVSHISNMFLLINEDIELDDDIRCTFLVTSADERVLVERYIAVAKPIMPLNWEVISAIEVVDQLGMTDLALAISENRNGGIINMKKLVGLYRALCEGADEICCVDSDILFVKSWGKLFEVCQRNYQKKVFIAAGSAMESVREVVEKSSSYFSNNDAHHLARIYQGKLYSWFFDVPFYVRSDLSSFFEHISILHGGVERALACLNWHQFEHILYLNYLLLRGDYKFRDSSAIVTDGRLSDDLSISELKAINESFGVLPAWATLRAVVTDESPESKSDFCVIFHTDRLPATI